MSKVDISRARVQRLIDMDAVPNYVVTELLNQVDRLQRAVTSAMDRLSNGDIEAGARLLRECFWGTAPEPEATEFWNPTQETRSEPTVEGALSELRQRLGVETRPAHTADHDCACTDCVKAETPAAPVCPICGISGPCIHDGNL